MTLLLSTLFLVALAPSSMSHRWLRNHNTDEKSISSDLQMNVYKNNKSYRTRLHNCREITLPYSCLFISAESPSSMSLQWLSSHSRGENKICLDLQQIYIKRTNHMRCNFMKVDK